MTTLSRFSTAPDSPVSTSWYLADLGEFRSKQELYTRQSPQRIKTLREYALIESAVASNRIEGVTVTQDRVRNYPGRTSSHIRDCDDSDCVGRGYGAKWQMKG